MLCSSHCICPLSLPPRNQGSTFQSYFPRTDSLQREAQWASKDVAESTPSWRYGVDVSIQSWFFEAAIVRIGTNTQRPVCSRLGFISSLGWVECGRTFERWGLVEGLLAIGNTPLKEIVGPQPLLLSFCFASCHGLLSWCRKKRGDSRTEISQTVGQIKPFFSIRGLSSVFVTVTDLWLTLVPKTCKHKMNMTVFPPECCYAAQ